MCKEWDDLSIETFPERGGGGTRGIPFALMSETNCLLLFTKTKKSFSKIYDHKI